MFGTTPQRHLADTNMFVANNLLNGFLKQLSNLTHCIES